MPEAGGGALLPKPSTPARGRRAAELLLAAASLAVVAGGLLLAEWLLRRASPHELGELPQAGLARLHRYSEAYGWQLRPGIRIVADGRRVSINRHGQRGSEHGRAPAPGRTRVLLLGDSIAFGHGVDDGETVARRLEERGFEVVNLAVPGYGTDQALLRLEREGAGWSPHAVVLLFCLDNDFVDNLSPYFFYDGLHPKPYFVLEAGGLRLRDEHLRLSLPRRAALWLRERSLLLQRLAPRPRPVGEEWRQRKQAVLSQPESARALTVALLARMARRSAETGAAFAVLLHPDRETYRGGSAWLQALVAARELQGLAVVDTGAAFRARGLAFREVALDALGHLSPRGHQETAVLVEEALRGCCAPGPAAAAPAPSR